MDVFLRYPGFVVEAVITVDGKVVIVALQLSEPNRPKNAGRTAFLKTEQIDIGQTSKDTGLYT